MQEPGDEDVDEETGCMCWRGVFSHSAVNNDELNSIQTLQTEFFRVNELIRRNGTT